METPKPLAPEYPSEAVAQASRWRSIGAPLLAIALIVAAVYLLQAGNPFSEAARKATADAETTLGPVPLPAHLARGAQPPAPRLDRLAPDFRLKSLDGTVVRLSDLHGKAVLLNFWATWCPPCRAEMPHIQAVANELKDQGLVVLAVDVQEGPYEVQRFAEELKLDFVFLLDETGTVTTEAYNVTGLPTSFFIDRNGVISGTNIGAMSKSTILAKAQRALEGAPIP